MNTKNIKEKVATLGLTMQISHLRKLAANSPVCAGHVVNASHIRGMGMSKFISCKGGVTLVKVIRDGKAVFGQAECHKNDSYNKFEGVKIATQRALQELAVPENVIADCVGV